LFPVAHSFAFVSAMASFMHTAVSHLSSPMLPEMKMTTNDNASLAHQISVSATNEILCAFGVDGPKVCPSEESVEYGTDSNPDFDGRKVSLDRSSGGITHAPSSEDGEECGDTRDSDSDSDENEYYNQRSSHHECEEFLFRSGEARCMSDDYLLTERVNYNQYEDYGANFYVQTASDDESSDGEEFPAERIQFDGPSSNSSYRFSASVPVSTCTAIVYGDMSDDDLSTERVAHNDFSFTDDISVYQIAESIILYPVSCILTR